MVVRMEGFGGTCAAVPSIGQCPKGDYGWLEVQCHAGDVGSRQFGSTARSRTIATVTGPPSSCCNAMDIGAETLERNFKAK
jgi:hypothetical protein